MINEMLKKNEIKVKINSKWFKLKEIFLANGEMPILVSDEDGEEYTGYDMADIDEFDHTFELLEKVNNQGIWGEA